MFKLRRSSSKLASLKGNLGTLDWNFLLQCCLYLVFLSLMLQQVSESTSLMVCPIKLMARGRLMDRNIISLTAGSPAISCWVPPIFLASAVQSFVSTSTHSLCLSVPSIKVLCFFIISVCVIKSLFSSLSYAMVASVSLYYSLDKLSCSKMLVLVLSLNRS